MPDDLTKRGPKDATRVNVHEEWELRYWCKILNTTPEKLKVVVKRVGPMVKDVEPELRK
jgi:hypothetical protein